MVAAIRDRLGERDRTGKRLYAIGEYVFDGSGEVPQPPDAAISELCASFGCLPDEALRQDARLMYSIMEYRTLQAAKAQHNEDATKLTQQQAQLMSEVAKILQERNG